MVVLFISNVCASKIINTLCRRALTIRNSISSMVICNNSKLVVDYSSADVTNVPTYFEKVFILKLVFFDFEIKSCLDSA